MSLTLFLGHGGSLWDAPAADGLHSKTPFWINEQETFHIKDGPAQPPINLPLPRRRESVGYYSNMTKTWQQSGTKSEKTPRDTKNGVSWICDRSYQPVILSLKFIYFWENSIPMQRYEVLPV